MPKTSIYSFDSKDYANAISEKLGRGALHALKVYSEWMRHGKVLEDVEKQAASLVEEMVRLTDFTLPQPSIEKEEGPIKKFLLKFSDGLESESVVIPMQSGVTLCISSQVGCRMGCAFCETGKMGLLRHLTTEEIIMQVFYAKVVLGIPVKNIVFMGMGEPFDNFEMMKKAIDILCDPRGLGFGHSRITVSTSGHVEGIERFTKEMPPAVNLAVSVNAPNDEVRSKIMPINQRWDMKALKDSLVKYSENPRRKIFAEYVLIKGVNDSIDSAKELGDYLQGLNVKVNVILYNPQSKDRFSSPDQDTIDHFIDYLRKKGYQVLLRNNKGRKIMAACGQLGNKQQRINMRERGSLPIM